MPEWIRIIVMTEIAFIEADFLACRHRVDTGPLLFYKFTHDRVDHVSLESD